MNKFFDYNQIKFLITKHSMTKAPSMTNNDGISKGAHKKTKKIQFTSPTEH